MRWYGEPTGESLIPYPFPQLGAHPHGQLQRLQRLAFALWPLISNAERMFVLHDEK